ncbi:MAG: hypothetical protein HC881_20470 [Leptolyngbyaceae cyanobacterium SL_7_1]|nr:hypothetical protein [Leptolyngbyaceae cyanobacterium SL_7_1]
MTTNSLAQKLRLKPHQTVLLLNAPEDYQERLAPLPEAIELSTTATGDFDVVQAFVHNRAEIETLAPVAIQALKPGGILWFSYPKKSSNVGTDIHRDVGWESVQQAGFEGVAQIAIDEVWSALRFRPTHEIKARRSRITTD